MTTQEATYDPGVLALLDKLADLAAGVDQLREVCDITKDGAAAHVASDLRWMVAELLAEVRAWPRNGPGYSPSEYTAEEVSARPPTPTARCRPASTNSRTTSVKSGHSSRSYSPRSGPKPE